jgi:hypothetical protein
MLTAVDAFEKATQTIKEKLRLLEGDKNMQGKEIITLKDMLATEKKGLNETIHKVQLVNNDLKDDIIKQLKI